MSQITLESIEAKQTELSQLIAQFKSQAEQPTLWRLADVCITLRPGERYAGPVLDEAGKVNHHLVLMAERPTDDLNWQAAMDWAIRVGGALPTRQEQALLFANCKPHLKPEWHWSCETHADEASYAWRCVFGHGSQHNTLKSYEGCAVAVRRV